MIIVRLQGGMGNQMFQYALGRVLSIKYNVPLKLDAEIYKQDNHLTKREYDLDVFNIKGELANRNEIPVFKRNYGNGKLLFKANELMRRILHHKGKEKSFNFDPSVFSLGSDIYLDGYWQSPKYFEGMKNIIRGDFMLKNSPSQNILNLANEIKSQNSLCIHVRRGDFVGNSLHEVVDREYYSKRVEHLRQSVSIDKIYIFSDDIEWCEKNMVFTLPTMFIGKEYLGRKSEGNLFLMSMCKYFIIPNSTFSWWGAWLSDREGKVVIVPERWFNDVSINTGDLFPKEWIKYG